MKHGHLPPAEAFHSISSTIMMTLEYPLSDLSLKQGECHELMNPIFDTALPMSEICHKFPQLWVYASKDVLGLGFANLYVTKGSAKVE